MRFVASPGGRFATRGLLVVAWLLFWQFAPFSRATRFWTSSPTLIAEQLWAWVLDGTLWFHLQSSLLVMAEGYALGTAFGVVFGFLLGHFKRVHRVLSPFLAAVYAVPKIALTPLFIIVLGVDNSSKVALVGVTVFFLILTATIDGVRDVDRDLVQSFSLMGATRLEIVCKLLMPASLPWIFTGMRIAVRYAFTNTLLAELIASNRGLGFLIEFNSGNFNTTGSYAAIVALVLCSVALTELLSRGELRVSRWRTH
jgi:NitT/TauT family transport system permease protein